MRRFHLAALFVFLSPAAQAADITVYSPGIVNAPLTTLAQAWTAETGNKVTLAGFNVGRIRTAVGERRAGRCGDCADRRFRRFRAQAGVRQPARAGPHSRSALWSRRAVRIPIFPAMTKFVAMVKQAGVLGYANPKVGSLTGGMVEDMLKRPEFAGVERASDQGPDR